MDAGTQIVEANGARIPLAGLGTWALRGRDCARLVEQAIRVGYRHIDTAQMYDNEREVGEALPKRPHRIVLGRKMRPDRAVAGAIEKRKKLLFLEIEVTLDFRLHAGRQIGHEPRRGLIRSRRRLAALPREKLLEPLHQRDGCAVLLVQNLTDAVGECHRCVTRGGSAVQLPVLRQQILLALDPVRIGNDA